MDRTHLKHIFVPAEPTVESYSPHPRKIDIPPYPAPASRAAHGQTLRHDLESAVAEASRRRQAVGFQIGGASVGLYVQFESQPGVPLKISSLEDSRQGIEVVAVTHALTGELEPRRIEYATVFVPEGKVKNFIKRFEAYAKTVPKKRGERRHEEMLDPVARLRLATLRGLWTDEPSAYPEASEEIWWEVWLRRRDDGEIARTLEFAERMGLKVSQRRLQFDDRIVMLLRATPEQLATSVDILNDLAEVRRAKESAAFFVDELMQGEQTEWVGDLLQQMTAPAGDAPAVCVLDTGVTRGHPLLTASLAARDCHTCEPSWGTHDHEGHGTEMAGLALFGDLTPLLAGVTQVEIRHRLESVKILPPQGENPAELYGAITAEATNRVEIQAPERRRCFSMAVTATDERDRGQPTSWSAAVDALAAGRMFESINQELVYLDDDSEATRRLFIISAGNVDPGSLQIDHLSRSDTEAVHDPGQAWNALTVGAYTDKAVVQHQSWNAWQALAPAGELSPWSTTGVTFETKWPIKPDVVFEGGNLVKNASGQLDFPCPDLCLLTTNFRPAGKLLVLSWATSAATALASRMAASIMAEYPMFWPETVRGIIVHSAEWTIKMKERLHTASGKRARARLVYRYGFGVPQLERALYSASHALTLVAQNIIHPFDQGKLREIQFFELPWPNEVLADLGETRVRLRVTLSYFIEPNPGRRGWKKRHSYASHGLRFEVRGPTESLIEFRKRLNKQALEEDERKPSTGGDSSEWYLGQQVRNRGSVHSDVLYCSAADLAQRGVVAVYPVSGWWKEQPKRDRSEKGVRYALLVSIETPSVDTDIYTPVAVKVGLAVPVVV